MTKSRRLNIVRATVLASAVAASSISLVAAAGSAFAASTGPKSGAPTCQVSAPAAPSFLDIQGQGFTSGTMYMVTMVNPNGVVTGNSQYANPDGTFTDNAQEAVISGVYHISITKLKGGPTLASCSTTVA